MSITFRIATDADDRSGPVAMITAPQLGAFQRYLRDEGARLGIVLCDPDGLDDDYLSYHFEARICPLALASVARVLDHDPDALAVRPAHSRSCCRAGETPFYWSVCAPFPSTSLTLELIWSSEYGFARNSTV